MFEKLFLAVAITLCLNFLLGKLPVNEVNTTADSLSVETQIRLVEILPQFHQDSLLMYGI